MADEQPRCYERQAFGKPEGCEALRNADDEIRQLRSAIWGYFELVADRPAQAEQLLRSALPDGYRPVGA